MARSWREVHPRGSATTIRSFHPQGQSCYVRLMATEIIASLSPAYLSKRRSVRYKLDVPLRIILHKPDATLIRDGRGSELSELGMCVMASLELGVGEKVEIEFTIPYSGEPIRVSGAVRNRNGYRYGCEFTPTGQHEQKDVARLHQVLQTFTGEQCS
jgi:PilZ domain